LHRYGKKNDDQDSSSDEESNDNNLDKCNEHMKNTASDEVSDLHGKNKNMEEIASNGEPDE
jgi:hypothetical protein